MQGEHGRLQLTGSNGPVSTQALGMGILAAQTRISELEMDGCAPQSLHVMASFGSLKSLALKGIPGPLSLKPLCAPPSAGPLMQLTTLALHDCICVTGLDMCLAHHPLQELQLIQVFFTPTLATSMHMASPTLRVMRIALNLTFPDLSFAHFPALRSLEISSLNIDTIGFRTEGYKQRCFRLATGIAGFPCVRITDTNFLGDPFAVWATNNSPELALELLQGLASLRAAFQSIKHLYVMGMNIGPGAMWVLASLFPNVEMLNLKLSNRHMYTDVEEGLVSAVANMPNLGFVILSFAEAWPPRDIIMALMRARKGFRLHLRPENAECYRKLQYVQHIWECMRRRLPDQCTATLTVMSVH